MTTETIARRLREARIERGLTMGQVAYKAGTTPDMIGRYERGKIAPGSLVLASICRALHVSADHILGLT